jgi:phosphoadenosine phosphosulfate reductase
MMEERIAGLNRQMAGMSPMEVMRVMALEFPGRITFATSFGAEDQVIMHMLSQAASAIRVFTLDTGRLFQETYDLMSITRVKYGIPIEVYFPDAATVEEMVNQDGINLFYDSIENRKLCCHVRKIIPLKRALANTDAWISGLRRQQSVTRQEVEMVEWDASLEMIKINPLVDWTEQMVWDYLLNHKVPVNELHAKGFPSIGCQPCTRAVAPGEDVRAGRWWWELPGSKECGLHKKP